MKLVTFPRAVSLCLLGILLGLGVWLSTQDPRFYFSRERSGVSLLRGHYRSWNLSWCDGYQFDPAAGKWLPMHMVEGVEGSNAILVPGYRLIPRFHHLDMQDFFKWQEEHK